jgi:hypothetical protein
MVAIQFSGLSRLLAVALAAWQPVVLAVRAEAPEIIRLKPEAQALQARDMRAAGMPVALPIAAAAVRAQWAATAMELSPVREVLGFSRQFLALEFTMPAAAVVALIAIMVLLPTLAVLAVAEMEEQTALRAQLILAAEAAVLTTLTQERLAVRVLLSSARQQV